MGPSTTGSVLVVERWAGRAALIYCGEAIVVQGPGRGGGTQSRRLVADLSTRRLADGFLEWKKASCLPSTIRKYKWALDCLLRVYPTFHRVTADLIRFVENEPFRSDNSRRNLWNTMADFYSWVKETEDSLAPVLPPIDFGQRRAGEKRGRKRRP